MKAWEKNIRTVVPYVPGEQPNQMGMIKLNTNENPYPPAPGVAKALRDMDADLLRRYPDPTADALVDCLAQRYHLEKEQVFVGVGSDDVLAMCFMTFLIPPDRSFFRILPIPSTMYGRMCSVFRMSASR